MYKLKNLFEELSYGELSNVAIGSDGSGFIPEKHQPKITLHANEGLLRLYSQFILLEKSLIIQMVEGITNYYLLPLYAETNYDPNADHEFYIKDKAQEPFLGDVIKVLNIYNEVGFKYPLNDPNNDRSLYTPQSTVLQVPEPQDQVSLALNYQARHPRLIHTNLEQEVILPDVLLDALKAFIAARIYNFMNTQDTTLKSQQHYSRYKRLLKEVVEDDVVNTSMSSTNTVFHDRGWV